MKKKKGPSPYDAPNADFELDRVMDPVEFKQFSPVRGPGPYPMPQNFNREPISNGIVNGKRPLLTLVRPTPTPSPAPENRKSKSEPKETSRKVEPSKTTQKDDDKPVEKSLPEESTQTPTSTSSSKGVTWGENETKHYEVESPSERRDEFVSSTKDDKHGEESQSKPPKKPSRWGAIRDSFAGAAAVGAFVAANSESSKSEKSTKVDKEEGKPEPFEYRGVVVEPEGFSQATDNIEQNPPPVGPKPSKIPASQMPGAFDDDLDFTAHVAAGLQDSGFDPNIVINDSDFHRRSSPGSEEPLRGTYQR
jgi:hypothetical protein